MNRLPRYQNPRLKKRIITGTRDEGKATPSEESKSFFQRNNIDVAFLVAVFTAISYAIVYCYKLAQFHYYHIPIDLIDINLKSVMWILFVFIIIAFVLYALSEIITQNEFLKKVVLSNFSRLLANSLLTLMSFIMTFFTNASTNTLKILNKTVNLPTSLHFQILVATSCLILVNFISILMIRDKKRKTKIATLVFTAVLGASLFLLPYSFGFYISYSSKYHYMVGETSPAVILTTYKDNFIVAPVDSKTKTITPKFSFIPIESDKDGKTQVQSVKTGILTIKKPGSIQELPNKNSKNPPH